LIHRSYYRRIGYAIRAQRMARVFAKISSMDQDYSEFRPSRIWKRLPIERRETAAELFWSDEQSAEQQVDACTLIATHMKFRAKSVLNLPLDRKTRYLVRLPNVSDVVAARALVNYHLGRQRPMMSTFLDALGIAHEEGLIKEDTIVKPDADTLRKAAEEVAGRFPAEDVALYFSTLVSQDPDTWGELARLPQTAGAV
jgi:hypothetical protein